MDHLLPECDMRRGRRSTALGPAARPGYHAPMAATALLLAAFPPELAGLDAAPPAGWRVATTGVGALAAAAVTARLLAESRPSRVLFVGTCGAYDGRHAVGDLVSVSEAVSVSLDVLAGRAYRPEAEVTRWEAGWPLPFPAAVAAVPPAITVDPEGAALLATLAAVEHLEVTGVFAACADAGVPAAAALAVANRVGPGAHDEWKASHARVSRALVAALAGVLAGPY
jgi:purine-nucleoside phosphorylase